MKKSTVLRFAYYGVLERWHIENERLQKNPSSELFKKRFQNIEDDLNEIRALLEETETIDYKLDEMLDEERCQFKL